ncbi:MAG: ribokinase [Cyanobacteria bacterium P01_H01_bin.35]
MTTQKAIAIIMVTGNMPLLNLAIVFPYLLMSIIIFGSINIDLIATTPRLPIPGETINGNNFLTAGGGKGANQAVAAARLGIPTKIVGRVGNDSFGQQLLTSLQTANVDTAGVVVDDIHTGVAVIAVDASGENSIIVVPGANHRINNTDVERLRNLLLNATALLLQLEIPLEFAMNAAKVAQEMGVKVILDPAPMPVNFPNDFYSLIDIITPNESPQLLFIPDISTIITFVSCFVD